MAKCSDKVGNNNNYAFDNDSSNWLATDQELKVVTTGEKRYCWCKVTGYKTVNQSSIYGPLQNLDFVFARYDNYVGHCIGICALTCAHRTRAYTGMRSALYGILN